MILYPASVFIIITLIYFFVRDKRKTIEQYFRKVFIFALCFIIFSNVGYFVEFGDFKLTYRAFFSIFLFFISLFIILLKGNYNKKIIYTGFLLVTSILIGYFSLAINPYQGGIIHLQTQWDGFVFGTVDLDYSLNLQIDFETIFKVIQFPVILSVAAECFVKGDNKGGFLSLLLKISNYILIYSIIELIAIKVFSFPLSKYITIPIFGELDTMTIYSSERLQGFFSEASHYAGAMFIWGLLNIFQINILKKSLSDKGQHAKIKANINICLLRLFIIALILIASTSFVGIMYIVLLILAALFYCTKINKIAINSILILVALLGLFIITNESVMNSLGLSSLFVRINRLIISINNLLNGGIGLASSEGARFTSMFYMIRIVVARPLFGVGAGLTDAHSTFFALLGNIGMDGTFFVARIYSQFGGVKQERLSIYFILIVYLMFAGSFGQAFDFQYPMVLFFAGYAFSKEKEICAEQDRQMVCEKLLV